jgi:hypothetical protein
LLLIEHIKRQEPTTRLVWFNSWSADVVHGEWSVYLQEWHNIVNGNGLILVFDEAQVS